MVSEQDFWELIERSRRLTEGSLINQVEFIESELFEKDPDTIKDFFVIFHRIRKRGYNRKLWGAAYTINRGFYQGNFENFESWLIAQGREFWEKTLGNPDEFLSQHIEIHDGENPVIGSETFYTLWESVFEEKTDQELEEAYPEAYQEAYSYEFLPPSNPLSKPEVLRQSYPRLFSEFYEHYEDRLANYNQIWAEKIRHMYQNQFLKFSTRH